MTSNDLCNIDEKYNIERPKYESEQLTELETKVNACIEQHEEWNNSWCTQSTLIRFLKANISVEKTCKKLVAYFDWRVSYDTDNLSCEDEDIKAEAETGKLQIPPGCFDLFGRPVLLGFGKLHDGYHGNYPRVQKHLIYVLEKICNLADTHGSDTYTLIFDLEGFAYRNMDYEGVKMAFEILQKYYPERINVVLIVNYPGLFHVFWNIVKLWLNSVTLSKILFCPSREMLADFVDITKDPFKDLIRT